MKKTFFLFLIFLCATTPVRAENYIVAVFDFDDRLDLSGTTAKYIEMRLKQEISGIRVDQYSGKNDVPGSIELLQELDTMGLDLIITITSDALIIARHVLKQTPVLFTNVNDPIHLGFETLGPPGGNISGVSYYISVEEQLEFYKKLVPDLSHIGFIFDRNNKSKKIELPESRNACRKMRIIHRIELVSSEQGMEDAASRLISVGVQAIALGSSDILYHNVSRILSICNEAGIPVFSFNKEGMTHGATAALSSDYRLMVDRLLIPMATLVLTKKKSPGEFPIAFLEENQMVINRTQIEKLKLKIPESIRGKAIFVH